MESTPKVPWSRKRKLKAKMDRLREAKLAKSDTLTSPSTAVALPEPTTSATPGESSETPSRPLQSEHEPDESLHESLCVRVTAQLSEDESSESDEGTESFSNDGARQMYQEWLKEQPKHNVKMMAVMFMDALIDRFNMTTHGAANEVGLILSHNEKTIRMWCQDFYINQGHFTESRQGKHARLFILDDEGLRHKAAEWVRANSTIKGKPNMTGAKFCTWVNTHLLPNAQLPPGCPQQIQTRTAIKWLHHLGFRPQSHKKAFTLMAMSETT